MEEKTCKLWQILNHNKTAQIKYLTQVLFSFFFLKGVTQYYNAIYILFTYFALFIGYQDDILEVIFLNVQGAKFGKKKNRFAGNL